MLEFAARGGQQGQLRDSLDQLPPVELAREVDDDFPFKDRVDYVDPEVDIETGTLRIRAEFDNQDGRLKGGLFAQVRLRTGRSRRAHRPGGSWTGPAGAVPPRRRRGRRGRAPAVEIGNRTEGLVISSRITADDAVIVNRMISARPGAKVRSARGAEGDHVLSAGFIHRPIFATVLSIVVITMGLTLLVKLPIAQYPDLAPPTIAVQANYPGANSGVVAETVAAPIEQEVSRVEGMLMSSISLGRQLHADDHLRAGHRPRHRVGPGPEPRVVRRAEAARGRAPAGDHDQEEMPDFAQMISVFSPDGSKDEVFLSNWSSLNLRDESSASAAWATRRSSAPRTTPCACGSILSSSRRGA